MPTPKPTTEELDKVQFGQVLHDRPGTEEMMAAITDQGIHEVDVDLRVLLDAAEARAIKAEAAMIEMLKVSGKLQEKHDLHKAARLKAEQALREIDKQTLEQSELSQENCFIALLRSTIRAALDRQEGK